MRALADRLQLITPSPTLTLDALAKSMKAAGLDIINLGVGEPDFQTPEHIKEAAAKAIKDGFTRYTPSEGILPLREAVCEKFKKDNHLDYKPSQIIISNGGKHSLFNIMFCLFQAGDEVIIPNPGWVTYPAQVLMSGANPVFAFTRPEDDYILTPESLEAAITPKTKGLILNSPSNPTGMVYSAEDFQALAGLIKKHNLWVISDDIYEHLIYDGLKFTNLPMACPELKDQTIIAHGVSKTFSMTGWRIGFMAGPEPIIKAATKIQSQMTSNPCSIAQMAALAAINGPLDCVYEMRRVFDQRRRLILELLGEISDLPCPVPKGAFYVFPNVSGYFGKTLKGNTIKSSDDLASVLLKECQVATVPGSGFGYNPALRLSYAASEDEITRGLRRIAEFMN